MLIIYMPKPNANPMEYAFNSMCDRLDRLAAVITDPYVKITADKRQAIKQAAEAIEQEWIIDPSMRAPKGEE